MLLLFPFRRALILAVTILGVLPPFAAGQEATAPATPFAIRWPFEPATRAEEREEREERDEIETDRDSFTPATTTAGRGRLIAETAYSFVDNRRVKETHSYPETLLRYGLTERFELRVGFNYEVGGAGSDVTGIDGGGEDFLPGRKLQRETQVNYGLKVRTTNQEGWIPMSSVIVQGSTPTSGKETASSLVATYVFGWELPGRWKLDAAMRYQYASEEGDRFNTWAPSVVLKIPVARRLNVHAEYFGLFSQDKEKDFVKHYFSPGFHYLVTDDLEVGVRVGWGLNDQASRFFVNAGVGLRF